MIIERTEKETIIKIPSSVGVEEIQKLLDYIKYRELLSKSTAKQEDVDALAEELNEKWWSENKDKFNK